jgi:hypothetical protein
MLADARRGGKRARPPLPDDLDRRLAECFGPAWSTSEAWPFDSTRYYEPEMGAGLVRSFRAYAPAPGGRLAAWKLATGALERRWGRPGAPAVNLDPGYVTLGGLFLASTKNGPQRIYLADGIYAELTLLYRRARWEVLPWTFPDFRSGRYDRFLTVCRARLKGARAGSNR